MDAVIVGTAGGLSLVASSVPGLSTIFKLVERGVGHAVRATYMMTKIAKTFSSITKKLWCVSLKARVFLNTVFSATAPYPMLNGSFCVPQLIIGMHSLLEGFWASDTRLSFNRTKTLCIRRIVTNMAIMLLLCLVGVINGVLPKVLTNYINENVTDISIHVELENGWILLMSSTVMSLVVCALNIGFYVLLFKKSNWDGRNLKIHIKKNKLRKRKSLSTLFAATGVIIAICGVFAPKLVIKENHGTLVRAKDDLKTEILSFIYTKKTNENIKKKCFPATLMTVFRDVWFRRRYKMVEPIKR